MVKLWESTDGTEKKRAIAEAAFKKSAMGRYSLDIGKPMFEEFHKREKQSSEGWKKEGKPRMLWAVEFAGAGGTYFWIVSLCLSMHTSVVLAQCIRHNKNTRST